MKDALQGYMARASRYENIDGTGEIRMGLMVLGLALANYLPVLAPKDSFWSAHGGGGFLAFYMVCTVPLVLGYFCRKAIKKHLTWPRTGYVAYCDSESAGKAKRYLLKLIVVFAMIAAITTGLKWVRASEGGPEAWLRTGAAYGSLAMLNVVVYAVWIRRLGGEHAWKWAVWFVMAVGLFAIGRAIPGNFAEAVRPAILFIALLWLLSGMVTLFSYLRQTDAPAEETR